MVFFLEKMENLGETKKETKEKKAKDIFDRIIKPPSDQSKKDNFREEFLKEMYIVEK